MLTHETAGARDFRRNLTRHLVAAEHGGTVTVVTRNGAPAAVLMPFGPIVDLAKRIQAGRLSEPERGEWKAAFAELAEAIES